MPTVPVAVVARGVDEVSALVIVIAAAVAGVIVLALSPRLTIPVVVVVDTTIFRFGIRGSSARMRWVQTFTSPTLTACAHSTCRLVMACFSLAS